MINSSTVSARIYPKLKTAGDFIPGWNLPGILE
jgi:hypothetical protein